MPGHRASVGCTALWSCRIKPRVPTKSVLRDDLVAVYRNAAEEFFLADWNLNHTALTNEEWEGLKNLRDQRAVELELARKDLDAFDKL